MRKVLVGIFASIAVVFCIALTAYKYTTLTWSQVSSSPRSMVHKVVVEVDGKPVGNGSGVMIAPMLMLTAGHVANAGPALTIDGERAPVRVLRVDPSKDLALMMVAVGCPCATLATGPIKVDQVVIAVGFPYNHLLGTQVLTEGRVQGNRGGDGALIISSPVARGNSGGGIFVKEGGRYKLAGIVVSVVAEGMGASVPHLAAATSLEQINTFLTNRAPAELDSVEPLSL